MSATPYSVMPSACAEAAQAAPSATHRPRSRTGARWWVVFMWSRVLSGVAFTTGTLHGGRGQAVAAAPWRTGIQWRGDVPVGPHDTLRQSDSPIRRHGESLVRCPLRD